MPLNSSNTAGLFADEVVVPLQKNKPVKRKIRKILNITPQTHVRATKGDSVAFRIPEDQLIEKYPNLYKRKMRLEKYNNYKLAIREAAANADFVIPDDFFHVTFYVPVPPSWRKKKKAEHHLKKHLSTPDADNMFKAMTDSLKKKDQTIWDFRATKLWINSTVGYIEIRYELPA